MSYNTHNFKSGDILKNTQLNEMDEQIVKNETEITNVKEDLTEIDNLLDEVFFSINLIDTANIIDGYYVNQNNGAYEPNANHNVIKNIPIKENTQYIFGLYNPTTVTYGSYAINNALRVAFFDTNKSFISGALCNATGSNTFTTPLNSVYISISWMQSTVLKPMFEIGDTLTPYKEYAIEVNKNYIDAYTKHESDLRYKLKSDTALNPYIKKHSNTIPNFTFFASGESNLLKEYTILFRGKVTSFNKLFVGIYYPNDTFHNRLEIDNAYVWNKNYNGNVAYYTHGLTISNDICVIINVHYNLTADFTIISNGESFTQNEIIWSGASQPTQAFAYNNGSVIDDCTIEQIANFNKPIFAFGDSYFNYNPARWMYYTDAFGYLKSILLNAVGGAISSWNTISKDTLIAHGIPKFSLWCVGMNDGSDVNENTPQPLWVNHVNSFIDTCIDKGITPILATIPNVPSISHLGKNKWVRESGYRYIDFAKAVGSDSNASWDDGLLSSDNVHPTENGAKVLFSQAIIDFPELIALSE